MSDSVIARATRQPENALLRAAIDDWQPTADKSSQHEVTATATLTETREVIGKVTWTRIGADPRKRVSVGAGVLWQMAQHKGPRVTLEATGKW